MKREDTIHDTAVRLTHRSGSLKARKSPVEPSECSPQGVIKVLERACAPDLLPESVSIGERQVGTAQYIAEIADIARGVLGSARLRNEGMPTHAPQLVGESRPDLDDQGTALLLAADATAIDQAAGREVGQPDAQS